MKYKRQHPAKILKYATKNFWFLSIPLLRGLVYLRFDFQTWVKGAWFDILILFLMLGFAVMKWLNVYYRYDDNTFYFKNGILFRQESEILFSTFSTVEIERNFWLIPFKAQKLVFDTNAGSKRKADFTLTMRKKDAVTFGELYTITNQSKKLKFSYYPKRLHLIAFSLIFSNTLSGVILIATLFFQGGKIVGNELERRFMDTFGTYAKRITEKVPPAALAVALVIIGGWLLSFLINLLRHWNFSCEKKGGKIIVRNGYFTKRTHFLSNRKINFVDLRQSLLTVIFRISSVHVHCSGYGKAKNAIAVLVPITTKEQIFNTMHMLLPEFTFSKATVRPTRYQVRRFIFFPILFIMCVVLLALLMLNFFPSWDSMIYFVCAISLIPLVWLLIVKIVADFTTGIGYSSDCLVLKYCRHFEFHTVIVPVEKISMIQITQSIAQKATDNCTLKVYTNAERTKYHLIHFLTYSQTVDFLTHNRINVLK